jgi:putative SOS response-associated peptidase YedK
MCARGAQHSDPERIARRFGVTAPLPNLRASWNVAPTQEIGVVRFNPRDQRRALDLLKWGLVPHWAKGEKPAFNTINAKAETIATAPAFRDAWQSGRRCLVPFDLYYEWQKGPDGAKQPYAIALKASAPLGLAGLWESKRLGGDAVLRSFTIITTVPNALTAAVHDRMPVIIAPADYATWLGETGGADHAAARALLRPYPADEMAAWAVDPRVGDWRNDDPANILPLAAAPSIARPY